MTDEEAIEMLKEFKKNGYSILYMEYGDRITTNFKLEQAIETILSLVQKQKLQIEDLEKSVEEIYDDYQDIGKTMFEYAEEIEKKDKRLHRQFKLLNKKDKMIEEAINIIAALDTDLTVIREQFKKEYCEFLSSEEDCCWKGNDCTVCIKKYLEKKARKS